LIVLSIIIIVQKESDIPIMIYGLLSAGILLGTISVIQVGFNFYSHNFAGFGMIQEMNIVDEIDSMRIGGSIGDPNIYAQVMLFIIPIAFERMINEKNLFLKLVAIWSFVATFLTVVFTYSRGAFIALALMVLFVIIYKKIPIKYLILGILILSLFIPFLPSNYVDRILTIPQSLPFFGNSVKDEVSYSGRWSEMVSAVMMFLDHPLIGVGVNNYKYHYLDYARRIGTDLRGTERNPHILYLQVLAEQGIIGFFAFMFIIYMMFRELLMAAKAFNKSEKYKKYGGIAESVMVGMFGWLTAALFLHLAYPRYFWIIYAFAFAINKIPSLYPYIFSDLEVE
jgi:O-antigen ligase